MNKNITIILLIMLLIGSNMVWVQLHLGLGEPSNEGTQAELEVAQRDNVIREMSELIKHQYSQSRKSDTASSLMNKFGSDLVEEDNDYVFFGATVKLKYENGRLVRVYW